jgi:3-deoxy-D-manno-octulosonate 8-phosphate phosphatase (KDO 8-P phosphatase)
VDAFMVERHNKLQAVMILASQFGCTLHECAFVGDDDIDLEAMRVVGVSFSPSDGSDLVRQCADVVLTQPGGGGCVREACELLVAARPR